MIKLADILREDQPGHCLAILMLNLNLNKNETHKTI